MVFLGVSKRIGAVKISVVFWFWLGYNNIEIKREVGTMDYKIKQLEGMLSAETNPQTAGYGAHLTHWAGSAKAINIDALAIQALIDHYKTRMGAKEET